MNAYMRQIQENGGIVTNRFPDMIARGFSYVTVLLNLEGYTLILGSELT